MPERLADAWEPPLGRRPGTAGEGTAHTTLSGLFWTFLGTGSRGLIQLFVLIVLARLLTIRDFGVINVAVVIVGVLTTVSQSLLAPAVVQFPHIGAVHTRVAFTVSWLLGAGLMALTWTTAGLFATFFRLDQLTVVLRTMSVIFPLHGVFAVGEALLQRHMRFRSLAIVDMITYALGYGLVGIGMALLGFGLWSFVGAYCAQIVVRTALVLAIQPHPMTPLVEPGTLGQLLRFGGGIVLAKFANYAAGQGDSAVVVRWLGAEALGLYGRAVQLMVMPAMFIGEVLDKVLFPGMARNQNKPGHLGLAYCRAIALIALLALPISAALLVLAPQIVAVLLGPKWNGVVAPLQIFAASMLFRTSYKISDATVRAVGAVYRRAARQAIYAVLVVGGAWVGTRWGLSGVALGAGAAIAVNFLLMAQLTLTLTNTPWRSFWSAQLPGLALAAAVWAQLEVVSAVMRMWTASPVLQLLAPIAVTLASLPVLLRYAPRVFLGPHGSRMLQTLAQSIPYAGGRSWLSRLSPGPVKCTDRRGPEPARPRPLIVEFAGLPGAGKTALSRAVAHRLRQRGIPVIETGVCFPNTSSIVRARKTLRVLTEILRRPGYAHRCARAVWGSRQRSVLDAIKTLHNWLFVSRLMRETRAGDCVLLLDQGLYQALWSIGYSARNGHLSTMAAALSDGFARPNLVVIVETSPETAAHRLTTRPHGGSRLERARDLDPAFGGAVRRWDELKELIVRLAAEPGQPDVAVVDNSVDGIQVDVSTLAQDIERLYEGSRLIRPSHGARPVAGVAG